MDFIIDAGNSNIVFAIYDLGYKVIDRIETNLDLPEIFFNSYYTDLLLENGILAESITHVSISSVVNELSDLLADSIHLYFGIEPVVLSGDLYANLPMRVPKPYEIGSDLVANAYSIFHKYQEDFIIVDFGTALTYTVVDAKTGIVGVTIAPGIKTALNALSTHTSKLPEVSMKLPDSVIGKNTTHAIQAGVMYGYIGMVKEIISRIKQEKGQHYKVIATGGLSEILAPLREEFDELDKNLTLDGIRLLGNHL